MAVGDEAPGVLLDEQEFAIYGHRVPAFRPELVHHYQFERVLAALPLLHLTASGPGPDEPGLGYLLKVYGAP